MKHPLKSKTVWFNLIGLIIKGIALFIDAPGLDHAGDALLAGGLAENAINLGLRATTKDGIGLGGFKQ